MQNRNKHITIIPAAAIMLSSVMFCSCRTTKNEPTKPVEQTEPADSIKEFVPLHPPVIVPHKWNEEEQ